MTITAAIENAAEVDYAEVARLHNKSFGQDAPGSRNRVAAYYHWKYTVMPGSRIAIARDKGNMVAMAGLIKSFSQGTFASQLVDIATDTNYRRRGLFFECLDQLEADAPPVLPMYCIPNAASMPLLKKRNWLKTSSLYIAVNIPFRLKRTAYKTILDFRGSAEGEAPILTEITEYIEARYVLKSPDHYDILSLDSSRLDGWIVLSQLGIGLIRAALIIDYYASDDKSYISLQSLAHEYARSKNCLVLISASDICKQGFFKGGLKVPQFMMPRRIDILCNPSRKLLPAPNRLAAWDAL